MEIYQYFFGMSRLRKDDIAKAREGKEPFVIPEGKTTQVLGMTAHGAIPLGSVRLAAPTEVKFMTASEMLGVGTASFVLDSATKRDALGRHTELSDVAAMQTAVDNIFPDDHPNPRRTLRQIILGRERIEAYKEVKETDYRLAQDFITTHGVKLPRSVEPRQIETIGLYTAFVGKISPKGKQK